MGGLTLTDVKRERILLLWSMVRETALAKGFCFYMGRSLQKNDTNAAEEHINIVEFSCSLSCSQNSLTSDKSLKNLKPIFFLGVA